MQKKLTVYNDV